MTTTNAPTNLIDRLRATAVEYDVPVATAAEWAVEYAEGRERSARSLVTRRTNAAEKAERLYGAGSRKADLATARVERGIAELAEEAHALKDAKEAQRRAAGSFVVTTPDGVPMQLPVGDTTREEAEAALVAHSEMGEGEFILWDESSLERVALLLAEGGHVTRNLEAERRNADHIRMGELAAEANVAREASEPTFETITLKVEITDADAVREDVLAALLDSLGGTIDEGRFPTAGHAVDVKLTNERAQGFPTVANARVEVTEGI